MLYTPHGCNVSGHLTLQPPIPRDTLTDLGFGGYYQQSAGAMTHFRRSDIGIDLLVGPEDDGCGGWQQAATSVVGRPGRTYQGAEVGEHLKNLMHLFPDHALTGALYVRGGGGMREVQVREGNVIANVGVG